MRAPIEKSVLINAAPTTVWKVLTDFNIVKSWVAEPTMQLEIDTTWEPGQPILMTGFHYGPFKNTGTVLIFEPSTTLAYTHLSSLSRLPDVPASYSTITFNLSAVIDQTDLRLTIVNFPTESIFKHLEFYWNTTLAIIRKVAEQPGENVKPKRGQGTKAMGCHLGPLSPLRLLGPL